MLNLFGPNRSQYVLYWKLITSFLDLGADPWQENNEKQTPISFLITIYTQLHDSSLSSLYILKEMKNRLQTLCPHQTLARTSLVRLGQYSPIGLLSGSSHLVKWICDQAVNHPKIPILL